MKQRISSLDLELLYVELKKQLEGYRLSNIYNIADSTRQFLLKFNKPDSKLNAIIDCGLRIHLTDFSRPIPATPSGFVVKLRKHLKSKRLTTVKRVANDRILVLSFSDGQFFLVLEFFSAGNVILLDSSRKILGLQRIVHEHENKVGQTYDMFDDTFLQDVQVQPSQLKTYSSAEVLTWFKEARASFEAGSNSAVGKKPKAPSIHKLLFLHEPHLSSDLISRNLRAKGIPPNKSCFGFEDEVDSIVELLNSTEIEVGNLLRSGINTGYIVAKKNPLYDTKKGDADLEYIYEQFHPFPPFMDPKDERDTTVIEIAGKYNKTVDHFFSTIESSKYALRIQSQEHQAKSKLENAKLDNEKRIQALIDVQNQNEKRGHAIIASAQLVEEAQNAVKGLVDQQMDWKTIEVLISNQQKKNNPIARLIKLPLDLEHDRITLSLPIYDEHENDVTGSVSNDSSSDESSDDDSSDSSDSSLSDFEADEEEKHEKHDEKALNRSKDNKQHTIDASIELSLSAYANASNYFNIKKSNVEKQRKVEKNAHKALKNIEQRIEKDLKKKLKETHSVLNKTRTPYFFEKFNWFISSEGFLVLMGKSGPETDQIYSRYIRDHDIFVSNAFDTHVWIKNPEETEVPPNTLMQAGIMCMGASPAWSKKIQSSPWWCFAKNVSKFDSYGGEVLPAGNFQIIDEKKKSFLPPSQLVMGFAFLWKTGGSEIDIEGEELVEIDQDQPSVAEQQNTSDPETEAASDPELDSETRLDSSKESCNKNNDKATGIEENQAGNDVPDPTADVETNEVPNNTAGTDGDEEDSSNQNVKKAVRGKKGKLKKMQRKYADQDEEERRIRLEALGTLKGAERQQQKAVEEALKQEERDQRKARRERQKVQQSLKFEAKERVDVDYQKILSEVSPSAGQKSDIRDIIPVFAPWSSLTKYKYKVKVQPGNAKKTKSLHEILSYFINRKVDESETDKESDWPCEHEFIKRFKEVDLVSLIYVDKLKVTIPGQNESKAKAKGTSNSKGKKKGKK